MNARKTMIVALALTSVVGQTPAFAQAPQDACIARDGQSGTWRNNPEGKWVKCKPAAAGSGLVLGGVIAAATIGALVVGLSGGKPSSP